MEKEKRKKGRLIFCILLSLCLVFSLTPMLPGKQAQAATTTTIDISTVDSGATIGGVAQLTENQPGDDSWRYNPTYHLLTLSQPNGNYTLTGTNDNLSVIVTSTNAIVKLDGVDITGSYGYYTFDIYTDCTITLNGANTLRHGTSCTFYVEVNDKSITINGSGGLTATPSAAGAYGVFLRSGTLLNIEESAVVATTGDSCGISCGGDSEIHVGASASLNAAGQNGISSFGDLLMSVDGTATFTGLEINTGSYAWAVYMNSGKILSLGGTGRIITDGSTNHCPIFTGSNILMGDAITLTMNNNWSGGWYYVFEKSNTVATHRWKLTGSITTTDPLLGDSINVLIPASSTGTITRENVSFPPAITSANSYSCVFGTGGNFNLTATGYPTPTLSLDGTQPTGVTTSGNTLHVANSVAAGTYTFAIKAANGILPDANQVFTLTVKAIPTADQFSFNLKDRTYNGKEQEVTIAAKEGVGGITTVFYQGVKGTEYPKSTIAPKDIGSYIVSIDASSGILFDEARDLSLGTFNIIPSKPSITKITPGKKQMKVSWKKVSASQNITKYQLRYRTGSTSKWITKTYAASKSSATIKKLKKGKKYQVQIQVYKMVGTEKYCSGWSGTKTGKKIK